MIEVLHKEIGLRIIDLIMGHGPPTKVHVMVFIVHLIFKIVLVLGETIVVLLLNRIFILKDHRFKDFLSMNLSLIIRDSITVLQIVLSFKTDENFIQMHHRSGKIILVVVLLNLIRIVDLTGRMKIDLEWKQIA